MHCPTAGHQEDVLHPLLREKADYIVGKFHRSNLKWDSGKIMEPESFRSLVKTSCAVRPRAASSASTNSRTAPLPPVALAMKFARSNTTDAALAGAAEKPAICHRWQIVNIIAHETDFCQLHSRGNGKFAECRCLITAPLDDMTYVHLLGVAVH